MAERKYEGMFILDSNHYARDPQGAPAEVAGLIEQRGGNVEVSRLWEERRLAYAVDGHRKGAYWLTYFTLDSGELAGLDRDCRLNGHVIRHLFLSLDPRVYEAMVQIAGGEAAEEEGAEGEGGEGEEAAAQPAGAGAE